MDLGGDDDVFKDSLSRRARWTLNIGPEECSKVFAMVLLLEKKMKESILKKADAEIISQVQKELYAARKMQPAATSGSVEEEKDAVTIDSALQDLVPLELVYEIRAPAKDREQQLLDEMLGAAHKFIKIETKQIENVSVPHIAHSVDVCKSDGCFTESQDLTVWALLVTYKLTRPDFLFTFNMKEEASTLWEFLELLADSNSTKEYIPKSKRSVTARISSTGGVVTFADAALAGPSPRTEVSPFKRFMYAHMQLQGIGGEPTQEMIYEYTNVWNTVCAPEFIAMIVPTIKRIGKPFPQGKTYDWKQKLEVPGPKQRPLNFVCNEVVGIDPIWAVNILMTPSRVFFPRQMPEFGAGSYTRFIALCRFDSFVPTFGMLVYTFGTKKLTFIDTINSRMQPKHLKEVEDWFNAAYSLTLGRDPKEPLPSIEITFFSDSVQSWETLCKVLGSDASDVITCVERAMNEQDKCTITEYREQMELTFGQVAKAGLDWAAEPGGLLKKAGQVVLAQATWRALKAAVPFALSYVF